MPKSMIKTETQQVARCSTEVFKSNCDFKLENFVELPDLFYCSEKVTIPGTDFYWVLQIKPNLTGLIVSAMMLISYNGNCISNEDYQDCLFSFTVNTKGTALWTEDLTKLVPFAIIEAPNLIAQNDLVTLLSDDGSITFNVEVLIKSTRLIKDVSYRLDTRGNLVADFEAAFKSDALKDFKLVVGKEEILVHKAILAARCPVFKRMFLAAWNESKKSEVIITDINFDTLKEMLHFLYTGGVTSKFSTLAMELFEAAHKYQIEDLIKACEMEIFDNLTAENAEAILKLINVYECDASLKEEAFKLYKKKQYEDTVAKMFKMKAEDV